MRKATIFLMALALALASAAAAANTMPPAYARRSRFLASVKFSPPPPPPPPFYDCSKKHPSICLAPGSPGATCCEGMCVDTESSFAHCGNCNKTCKFGKTCCGGRCVDLLNNKKNCGNCFVQCSKKCKYGLCNYAG